MDDNKKSHAHQQDDCQDCQKERMQNKQLIECYERLSRIRLRAASVKSCVQNHTGCGKSHAQRLEEMSHKVANTPTLNPDIMHSKQMGYQLAIALMERDISMRKQNQALQNKVTEMSKRKNSLRSTQTHLANRSLVEASMSQSKTQRSSRYSDRLSDTLDQALEGPKDFWAAGPIRKRGTTDRHPSASFVNPDPQDRNQAPLGETGFRKNSGALKHDSMNLWLYEYEAQNYGNLNLGNRKRCQKY